MNTLEQLHCYCFLKYVWSVLKQTKLIVFNLLIIISIVTTSMKLVCQTLINKRYLLKSCWCKCRRLQSKSSMHYLFYLSCILYGCMGSPIENIGHKARHTLHEVPTYHRAQTCTNTHTLASFITPNSLLKENKITPSMGRTPCTQMQRWDSDFKPWRCETSIIKNQIK